MKPEQPSITCPICWRTSFNVGDIHNGYCGWCHAFTKPPAMFGLPMRDRAALLLGTGFWGFASPLGIDGLMKWDCVTRRLDLLAVVADRPNTGQFRTFIKHAKSECAVICVWTIWNEQLETTLKRYGFRAVVEDIGEPSRGMRWDIIHDPSRKA